MIRVIVLFWFEWEWDLLSRFSKVFVVMGSLTAICIPSLLIKVFLLLKLSPHNLQFITPAPYNWYFPPQHQAILKLGGSWKTCRPSWISFTIKCVFMRHVKSVWESNPNVQLRAGSLSGATLQGLHSILQHIWQYDYPACMQVLLLKRPICPNLKYALSRWLLAW